jgi:phage terminase small subunit
MDAGYDRKTADTIGLKLLADNEIKEAIDERRTELNKMIDDIKFEKEDLMRIYWDMFNDAKKKGKLADARAILADIARYNGVNPDEVKKEIAILNFNLDGNKI